MRGGSDVAGFAALVACVGCAFAAVALPRGAGASSSAAPKRATLVDVVRSGGGPADFKAMTLLSALAGSQANTEAANLTRALGAASVKAFVITFDVGMADARRLIGRPGLTPSASPSDSPPVADRALAAALFSAGLDSRGQHYSVDRMLDNLLSPAVHIRVANDINARFGVSGGIRFRAVLARVLNDIRAQYTLSLALPHTNKKERPTPSGAVRSFDRGAVAVDRYRNYDESSFGGSCGLKKSCPPLPLNVTCA